MILTIDAANHKESHAIGRILKSQILMEYTPLCEHACVFCVHKTFVLMPGHILIGLGLSLKPPIWIALFILLYAPMY